MGTNTIGWALAVISGAVLCLTFPMKGSAPLAPGLIPVFGVLFSILFLMAQICLLWKLRSGRGWWLWGTVAAFAILLSWSGRALDVLGNFSEAGITYPRHILCSAACGAGLALGIAMIRYWVQPEHRDTEPVSPTAKAPRPWA